MRNKEEIEEFNAVFADRLKKVMDYRHMSVRELADASGRSESAIRSWLGEKKSCKLESLMDLAASLQINPGYLFGDSPLIEDAAMNVLHKMAEHIRNTDDWTKDPEALIRMTDDLNDEQRNQLGEYLLKILDEQQDEKE